jgi:REP element-mobilizing transposase RayT
VPRAPRNLQPDGYFHVTSRGNRQAAIFVDDLDRLAFLGRLAIVTERVPWSVLAYCLMTNHAHLLVHARVEELSKAMHLLAGWYAQRFNKRHEITGHHFQGRFGSEPAVRDAHLLATVRYVALNPVEAGLSARPQDWEWSSYSAAIGKRQAPRFLKRAALHELFGPTRATAIERMREFVEHDGTNPLSVS